MPRKLYLIPIIHLSTDLGSLASAIDQRAISELGQELWEKHKSTVNSFWDTIGLFLDSLEVNGFRLYQDGLVADGAEGLEIVRQGISQGSKNYQIIGRLLARGAVLIKTEEASLVSQEYRYLVKITSARSAAEREVAAFRYKLAQSRLLKLRDNHIAQTINETLSESQTGILFIGAYHDIAPGLAPDIKVTLLKEIARVREYHRSLLSRRKDAKYLQKLAEYLVSPISGAGLS